MKTKLVWVIALLSLPCVLAALVYAKESVLSGRPGGAMGLTFLKCAISYAVDSHGSTRYSTYPRYSVLKQTATTPCQVPFHCETFVNVQVKTIMQTPKCIQLFEDGNIRYDWLSSAEMPNGPPVRSSDPNMPDKTYDYSAIPSTMDKTVSCSQQCEYQFDVKPSVSVLGCGGTLGGVTLTKGFFLGQSSCTFELLLNVRCCGLQVCPYKAGMGDCNCAWLACSGYYDIKGRHRCPSAAEVCGMHQFRCSACESRQMCCGYPGCPHQSAGTCVCMYLRCSGYTDSSGIAHPCPARAWNCTMHWPRCAVCRQLHDGD